MQATAAGRRSKQAKPEARWHCGVLDVTAAVRLCRYWLVRVFEDDSARQAALLRRRPERRPGVVRGGRRQQHLTPVGRGHAPRARRLVSRSAAAADAGRLRRQEMSRRSPGQRRRQERRQPPAAVRRQSLAQARIYVTPDLTVINTPLLYSVSETE